MSEYEGRQPKPWGLGELHRPHRSTDHALKQECAAAAAVLSEPAEAEGEGAQNSRTRFEGGKVGS